MSEFLVLGIVLSGFMILFGATFLAKRVFAITVFALLGGAIFSGLASDFPSLAAALPGWLLVAVPFIFGIWLLQFLLTLLFGKKVAQTAVGQLVSQMITALAKIGTFPFRWLQRSLRFIRSTDDIV